MTSLRGTVSIARRCSPIYAAGTRLVVVWGWMSMRARRRCDCFVAASRCVRFLEALESGEGLFARAWRKQG